MQVETKERNCWDCMNLKVKNNVIRCKFEQKRELVTPIPNQKSAIKAHQESFFRVAITCPNFDDADEDAA